MATLTRTRQVHDDVIDTPRDLRLGIPSPFPSTALAGGEDDLLADEQSQLEEVPNLEPTIAQVQKQDDDVEEEKPRQQDRSAVSVCSTCDLSAGLLM